MGEPVCWGTKDVCRVRVARLSASGAPDDGASNGYVTDALISIAKSTVVEAGEDEVKRNGCGVTCQQARTDDVVIGSDITLTLCTLDPQLLELMIDGTLFVDAGTSEVMGMKEPSPGDTTVPFCLEWWTKAWDGSGQAEPLILSGSPGYWHHVVPLAKGRFGDLTFENAITDIVVELRGRPNPNITANGPFNDWDADVAARNGVDSGYGFWLDANLPTASCEYVNVPTGS